MKKFIMVLMSLLAVCLLGSCLYTASGTTIEGDITQEKVNAALEQIYSTYRPQLDLTGAAEYTVVEGDTLAKITRAHYGNLKDVGDAGQENGFYFAIIMTATGDKIVDPDFIQPGMVLKIPDLKKNLNNGNSRQAIKDCTNDVAYVYNKKGDEGTEKGLRALSYSL